MEYEERTIPDVFNCETGERISSNTFFKKPIDELTIYRSELQKAIENFRDPLFTCYMCRQKVRIRGGPKSKPHQRKVDIFHFAHLKDSEDCHYKTQNIYSKEEVDRIKYNGEKESVLHQTLKAQIAECLQINQENKKEISSIKVEKVIRNEISKEWKKPDINAIYLKNRIAIELQLSTTWLDVITRRQHFYKEQGIYMFWVFHHFNINDDERRLTDNDVVYTNNQNAYVFNKETYEKSQAENDLILKCYYKTYRRVEEELKESWQHSFIKLSDLTFDEKKVRIFFKDSESQKKEVEQEIENHLEEIQESERLKLAERCKEEQRRKDLKIRVNNLKDEIEAIEVEKKSSIKKQEKGRLLISNKNDLISKTGLYAKKIVEYFLDNRGYGKPYYPGDELLESLKSEFAEKTKRGNQIIIEKKKDLIETERVSAKFNKIEVIEIRGTKYFSINNKINWKYIKANRSEFKVIHKNLIHDLFAQNEMKIIETEYDLIPLQFSNDFLFLTDLSQKITAHNELKKEIETIIEKEKTEFKNIEEKIKKELEMNLLKEILEEDSLLKTYHDKLNLLSEELEKKQKVLSDVQNFLNEPLSD